MVAVDGQPTQVVLRLQVGARNEVPLRDDGTGGDTVGGDRIFTATLQAGDIIGALRDDDVQRVFVGFLDLRNASTTVQSINTFADVYTPNVPVAPITRLAQDVQGSPHLVNINDPAFFTDGSVTRIARRFYQFFGDDYDFLNFVSAPARIANRTHSTVKNEVDGIGLSRSDGSATFGSGGGSSGSTGFPSRPSTMAPQSGTRTSTGISGSTFSTFFPSHPACRTGRSPAWRQA